MTRPKFIGILTLVGFCAVASGMALAQDTSQTATAGRQVREAQTAVEQARMQVNRLRTRAKAQLEARPQWASVSSELKKAQEAFDADRKAVLAKLQKDPAYRQLQNGRREAQAKLASADDADSHLADSDIRKATDEIFSAGIAMKRLEDRALADDQPYLDAKARLDGARAKMDDLDAVVTDALKNDQDFQQATQQLAQAEQQVTTAREQLAQAAQAEREARIQEEKSREQQGFERQ